MKQRYIGISDGYCQGNGSYFAKAGGSYAVFKVENQAQLHPSLETLKDPVLSNLKFKFNQIEGERVTSNNVAEGETLYMLLLELINHNILTPNNYVTIYSDSKLIINQIRKLYKVNNPQLKKTHKRIDTLLKLYKDKWNESIWDSFQLKHIPGSVVKQTIINH